MGSKFFINRKKLQQLFIINNCWQVVDVVVVVDYDLDLTMIIASLNDCWDCCDNQCIR